jgi:CheY-like chemotaxis protein
VLLIGEMRDDETASIGVQAAMTGHLVLATLHTNDAVGTMPRLSDLSIDRNSLADTLRGALAQRLVRRLCRNCAVPMDARLTDKEKQLNARFGMKAPMRAVGCDECARTGYRGRIPVVEVLIVTPQMQELIAKGSTSGELQKAAIAGGMRPMVQVALDHVRKGSTTLEEVERVLGEGQSEVEAPVVVVEEEVDSEVLSPTVLVVDDDPVIRQLARFVLGTADYTVVEAENGKAALDHIARLPVSLVVLDLDMPEMSGLEVLDALRSNRATMALPTIVLTASDSAEAKVMDAGADDYIRKPLDPERFLSRIKAVLRRASL